jgi:hypothetical protein
MLSYKYYQNPANKNINIPHQLVAINKILKDEYHREWTETLGNLANPRNTNHNKYCVWDMLAENADEILNSSMMSQTDKLYCAKLLVEFRDRINIAPGVEFYCLRYIIRLAAFRYQTTVKWIATNIANRIRQLQTHSKTKKQCIIFTRNIKKIDIIKRIYKSRAILNTHWRTIYDCLKMGSISHYELLNQTDILKNLNISSTTQAITDNTITHVATIELEKIDKILDDELLIDSDADSLVGLTDVETAISFQPGDMAIDGNAIHTEQIEYTGDYTVDNTLQTDNEKLDMSSPIDSDMEDNIRNEIDYQGAEPDEWYH